MEYQDPAPLSPVGNNWRLSEKLAITLKTNTTVRLKSKSTTEANFKSEIQDTTCRLLRILFISTNLPIIVSLTKKRALGVLKDESATEPRHRRMVATLCAVVEATTLTRPQLKNDVSVSSTGVVTSSARLAILFWTYNRASSQVLRTRLVGLSIVEEIDKTSVILISGFGT
ncbi:UNVERIFIED_CONTAM: hypothetical protein NCL1_14791 [Trichonephila clavipes]